MNFQEEKSVSAVKSLCERIDNTFFEVLEESYQAASYLLAELYRLKAITKHPELIRLNQTLMSLKKKLQPVHITLLWQAVNLAPSDWEVLDPGSRKSLLFLKKSMLAQRTYLSVLPVQMLLVWGKKPDDYREVLIALVRKRLLSLNQTDPFIEGEFSYPLLRKGGTEQNFLYLSRYMALCASLPIAEITMLGTFDCKVAELILKDLTNTLGYFEVSANLVGVHRALRLTIANQWQAYVQTYPLNESIQAFIGEELPHLKKRYPEFRKIMLDNRVERHYHITPPCESIKVSLSLPRFSHFRSLRPVLGFIAYGIDCLKQHLDEQLAQKARKKV
jgi:hypothetical protein